MYRALYRKWRPARFEDVVGQQAIVSALQNQLKTGRVGHAYLFTGTRGTGKTTCAKIFAKAVNCPNCTEGDPCGVCPVCRGIDDGSILDVVEIDAASNNGVDNIRDLRDETAYTPTVCRYKVYIIDEVHMLSAGAFNALLKIMEEPPSHVLFILATTESHKVPATILSRCQRYQFDRISPDEIAARLEQVAGEENISLAPDAAELIARLADGALRDALSILDTCAGVSAEVDEALVRRMAGVTERTYLFSISDALTKGDITAALAEVAALRQRSVDLKRLCEELIGHYRNLMLAGLPGGQELVSGTAPEERQGYLQRAKEVSQTAAAAAIRQLGEALERMGRSGDPRIELELALFAIAMPQTVAQAQPQPAVMQPAPATPPPFAVVPPMSAAPVQPFAAAPAAPPAPSAGQGTAPGMQPQAPAEGDLPPWTEAAPPVPAAPRTAAPQPKPARQAAPVQHPRTNAVPPAAAQPQAPAVSVPQPFAPWPEVVSRVQSADISLYPFLKESKAYFDGRRVLIDGGEFFREFIRQNKESQERLKDIIEQVCGQRRPIGPYQPPETAQKAAPVLEETLNALRAQGVDVVYHEDE